jgi:hypothetical protein
MIRTIRKLIIKQRAGHPDEEEQMNRINSTFSGSLASLINLWIKRLHKPGHPAE